jgi:hypothetical protein
MHYCPAMEMWIQLKGRDGDVRFSDDATYEIHQSGALVVTNGTDIRLYSPTYWQEVTIDTRSADQRLNEAPDVDDDLKWQ